MKNLKKVLSLVLALAMALSLMTVAFADVTKASSMTNYDKTSYAEAMDVMVALGVIDGVSGDLAPTQNVTREQAAKIIATILNGGDATEMTTTSAYFSDVAATRWSAGYIAYCVEKGIVSGVGGGKFNPTGNVTGNQFAKMLLVALGYDATIEQYTGTNWAVNVYSDANDASLYKGVSTNKNTAATREEICKYALNALSATMVEYDTTGTNINIGGANISVGASKAAKVYSTESYANKIKANSNEDGWSLELGEKYFTSDSDIALAKKTDKSDDFGRPAHIWTIKAGDIGTYADTADESVVVADAGKDLAYILTDGDYLDLEASDFDAAAVTGVDAYLNGDDSISTTEKVAIGDTVELFDTDDDGDYNRAVIVRYTVAKIDSIDKDLSSTDTKNGASVLMTVTDLDGNDYNDYYDDYNSSSKDTLAGYNANYTEGTVIAVAFADDDTTGKIIDSYVAEKVSGALTAFTANKNATIGGTKYVFAATNTASGSVDTSKVDGAVTGLNIGDDYNLYLDSNGYVVGIDGASSTDIGDVYYVTGIWATKSSKGTMSYYAQAVKVTDGTAEEIQLEPASYAALTDGGIVTDSTSEDKVYSAYTSNVSYTLTATDSFVGKTGLYTFSDKTADKTVSVKIAGASSAANFATKTGNSKYVATAWSDNDFVVKSGSLSDDVAASDTKLTVNGNKRYLNSDTFYIGVEDVGDDLAVKSATGGMKAKSSDLSNCIVISDADSSSTAMYVLYIGSDLSGSVTGDDVVYLADAAETETGDDTYEVTLYFMKDMTSKTVTITDKNTDIGFYTYDINSDGEYDLDIYDDIDVTSTVVDDDADGVIVDAVLSNLEDKKLLTGADNTNSFEDASIANATIIDSRGSSLKKSTYDRDITTAARLSAAMDDYTVTADVYFVDGDITFICVQNTVKA